MPGKIGAEYGINPWKSLDILDKSMGFFLKN
jgi:hypothetical protein